MSIKQRRRQGFFFWLALAILLSLLTSGMAPSDSIALNASAALANKVIFFASDGMRPDLMERYAAAGAMPTYASLMANGARGNNGMTQGFPPNTGVGWYTLMTGTWPSEHGSTNNTYFRTGDTFSNRTSFSAAGSLQADTLAAAPNLRWLVVVAIINSIISVYYYLYPIVVMFFRPLAPGFVRPRVSAMTAVALVLALIGTLYLGILPNRVMSSISPGGANTAVIQPASK